MGHLPGSQASRPRQGGSNLLSDVSRNESSYQRSRALRGIRGELVKGFFRFNERGPKSLHFLASHRTPKICFSLGIESSTKRITP